MAKALERKSGIYWQLFMEIMENRRKWSLDNYIRFFLQVMSCMYVFLTSFGTNGICMWFLAHNVSLAGGLSRLAVDFPSLPIS